MTQTQNITTDIAFVKSILPDHYTVQESKKKGSIHCKSSIGIKQGTDAEDDEHWGYIMSAIKKHFGERFQEVFHNTCFCHVDFTIYLKQEKKEFYLPPDHGDECWTLGAETFTRKEVAHLLWTQRAMIANDLKSYCGDNLTPEMFDILKNPRTPEF